MNSENVEVPLSQQEIQRLNAQDDDSKMEYLLEYMNALANDSCGYMFAASVVGEAAKQLLPSHSKNDCCVTRCVACCVTRNNTNKSNLNNALSVSRATPR